MKTSTDINTIMYKVLSSAKLGNKGGIYKENSRPTNSEGEDVVVNCIVVSCDSPQEATTNVNVYVKDIDVNKDGVTYKVADTKRLNELNNKVLDAILKADVEDVFFYPESTIVLSEDSIHQHYVNIRLGWTIN